MLVPNAMRHGEKSASSNIDERSDEESSSFFRRRFLKVFIKTLPLDGTTHQDGGAHYLRTFIVVMPNVSYSIVTVITQMLLVAGRCRCFTKKCRNIVCHIFFLALVAYLPGGMVDIRLGTIFCNCHKMSSNELSQADKQPQGEQLVSAFRVIYV